MIAQLAEARLKHEVGRARMLFAHVHDGLDAPRPRGHHHDAVGQEHGFRERMRDKDDGLARLSQKDRQILAEHHARLLVERGEGLVHQENVGLHADAARHVDALAHADGELRGIMIGEARHAHCAQRLHGAVVPFGLRHVLEFQRNAEILDDRVPGEQRAFLEHEGNLVGMRRAIDATSADQHFAFRRAKQAAHDVEQRALSAARGSEQADELTARDVERHIVERQHGLGRIRLAIALRDVPDGDRGRRIPGPQDAGGAIGRQGCAGLGLHGRSCGYGDQAR